MALIEKRVATDGDLKWFGLIIAACFAVFGTTARLRGHHHTAVVLWCAGGGLAVIYYAVRPIQRLMYDLWTGITYPIPWAVSHLMLGIVYFFVLTPIGLLMRLFGRDSMQRTIDRSAVSYWTKREFNDDPERYFRQS